MQFSIVTHMSDIFRHLDFGSKNMMDLKLALLPSSAYSFKPVLLGSLEEAIPLACPRIHRQRGQLNTLVYSAMFPCRHVAESTRMCVYVCMERSFPLHHLTDKTLKS